MVHVHIGSPISSLDVGPSESVVIDGDRMTISSVTIHVEAISVNAIFDEKEQRHRITICYRLSGDKTLTFVRVEPCGDLAACTCVVSIDSLPLVEAEPQDKKTQLGNPTTTGLGAGFLEVPRFDHKHPLKHVLIRETGGQILAVADVRRSHGVE
jgi:hypothetical protein